MSKLMTLLKIHHIQQLTISKILPTVVLVFIFLATFFMSLLNLSRQYDVSISVGALIFPFTDIIISSVIVIAYIMLVTHLPFQDALQYIMITKTGIKKWMMSQLVYVFSLSLLFSLSIAFFSIIILQFNVDFSNQWGSLLRSMAEGLVYSESGHNYFPNGLYMQNISPWVAVIRTYSILFTLCVTLGWLNLIGNTIRPMLGTIISYLLVLLHLFFEMQSGIWVQFVSPVTWINPYLVKFDDTSGLLSFETVIFRFVILLTLMCLVLMAYLYFYDRRGRNNE